MQDMIVIYFFSSGLLPTIRTSEEQTSEVRIKCVA
jgi:hypothetical protein